MGKLKDWWGTLEPRQQKFVIIGIAGLVVLLLAIVGGQRREPQDPRQRTEKPQTTFIGDDKGEADIAALILDSGRDKLQRTLYKQSRNYKNDRR